MNIHLLTSAIVCLAAVTTGALHTGFQLYKIVSLDAQARGLSHPKLRGMLAASGNNSSGLLMYFISRRNYPVIHMSEEVSREIESRKKRAGAGIVFLASGAAGLVITIFLI